MKKNERLTHYAQELRKNATKEENALWYQYLRRYPVQFRRQCIFGTYITDFYCAKAMLVIELDGSQHYEQDAIQRDLKRTQYLESLGLYVLRVYNTDINQNLCGVCEAIDRIVKQRLAGPINGPGRSEFTTLQNRGREAPHPPPLGAPSPQGEGFELRTQC
jgi:very-short-patch-repair endonuclease